LGGDDGGWKLEDGTTLLDANDDLILELAVAAGCRYIVTHNLRDFRGTETWGIAAVTPGDFLKRIRPST
jgi:hypothetical protein